MTVLYLLENFNSNEMNPALQWYCPPNEYYVDTGKQALIVKPEKETDYWRKTHYGFEVDNGHFLYAEVSGDFVLTARIRAYPVHQYDQAGLMVRFSETCWLKTSVEYDTQGAAKLGVVVTNNGYSDWSTQNFRAGFTELLFRIRREAGDYIVEFAEVPDSEAGGIAPEPSWSQLRIAHLFEDLNDGTPCQCGLYACSPQGHGFTAEFVYLEIKGV